MKPTAKNKIEVLERANSKKVIATYHSVKDFSNHPGVKTIDATRIVVNGFVLMGWDELHSFLKK